MYIRVHLAERCVEAHEPTNGMPSPHFVHIEDDTAMVVREGDETAVVIYNAADEFLRIIVGEEVFLVCLEYMGAKMVHKGHMQKMEIASVVDNDSDVRILYGSSPMPCVVCKSTTVTMDSAGTPVYHRDTKLRCADCHNKMAVALAAFTVPHTVVPLIYRQCE